LRDVDYIQVQPPSVPEQDAAALAPGHDEPEQAAPCLLRGQLPLPAGEDEAVGVPEPEDALVHRARLCAQRLRR
jgi:hypothetical protein